MIFAIGKHASQLALEIRPFDRSVKIVERQRAAAQQELAQDRHLGLLQPEVARFDHVDPRIGPEIRILERQHDRIVDLNRRRGAHAAREILFGRRRVDEPGLVLRIQIAAARNRPRGVANARERPLQTGESRIGHVAVLRVGGLRDRGDAGPQQQGRARPLPGAAASLPVTGRAGSFDGAQQQFLGAIEARRNLERRERFGLRIGRRDWPAGTLRRDRNAPTPCRSDRSPAPP